jgi:hypothetical protein
VGSDVPCTLLYYIDGVLKDVATGSIMQPGNRLFHGRTMPPNVLRVSLAWTLEDCDNVMPPFKAMGDKDDKEPKVLKQCFSSIMLWLENQIHLGAGSTTPQITQSVGPGPSIHVAADPNPDMQMAQDPNDDDDDVNIDAYINTTHCDDLNNIEEPAAGPSEK